MGVEAGRSQLWCSIVRHRSELRDLAYELCCCALSPYVSKHSWAGLCCERLQPLLWQSKVWRTVQDWERLVRRNLKWRWNCRKLYLLALSHSEKAEGRAGRRVTTHKSSVGVLCWFRIFEQFCQENFYVYTLATLTTYYKLSLPGKHTFLQQICNIEWTGCLLYWMLRSSSSL